MRKSAESAVRGEKAEVTVTADIMTLRTVTARGTTSRESGTEFVLLYFQGLPFFGALVWVFVCEYEQLACPYVGRVSMKIQTCYHLL